MSQREFSYCLCPECFVLVDLLSVGFCIVVSFVWFVAVTGRDMERGSKNGKKKKRGLIKNQTLHYLYK